MLHLVDYREHLEEVERALNEMDMRSGIEPTFDWAIQQLSDGELHLLRDENDYVIIGFVSDGPLMGHLVWAGWGDSDSALKKHMSQLVSVLSSTGGSFLECDTSIPAMERLLVRLGWAMIEREPRVKMRFYCNER